MQTLACARITAEGLYPQLVMLAQVVKLNPVVPEGQGRVQTPTVELDHTDLVSNQIHKGGLPRPGIKGDQSRGREGGRPLGQVKIDLVADIGYDDGSLFGFHTSQICSRHRFLSLLCGWFR